MLWYTEASQNNGPEVKGSFSKVVNRAHQSTSKTSCYSTTTRVVFLSRYNSELKLCIRLYLKQKARNKLQENNYINIYMVKIGLKLNKENPSNSQDWKYIISTLSLNSFKHKWIVGWRKQVGLLKLQSLPRQNYNY